MTNFSRMNLLLNARRKPRQRLSDNAQ